MGCGTGENALYLAHLGFEVWGIDAAPSAIKKAKEKAKKREITVNFLVSDALKLQLLQTFHAVFQRARAWIIWSEESNSG